MKRVLACLSLVAATGTVAFSAPAPSPKPAAHAAKRPAHAPTPSPAAPADEYFGRLKMSILGIRNTIKDLGIKVDTYPDKADSIWGSADLMEDAIRDWQKKYPHDSWLPGTYYALSHMYTKVANDEGRKRAKRSMQYLVAHFPKTKFAKDGKIELASNLVGAPVVAAAAADPNAPSAQSGTVAASGSAAAGTASAVGAAPGAVAPAGTTTGAPLVPAAAPSPAPTQAPR